MYEGRANTAMGGEGYAWDANSDNQIDLHAAVEAQSWDQFLEAESARKAAEEAHAVEVATQEAIAEIGEMTPEQQVQQIHQYGRGLQDFRHKAMQPDFDLAT